MAEAHARPDGRPTAGARREARPCFAALDLGTNNCRLLIATPDGAGFRVVEAFSRIVRLGEGLSLTGRLSEAAMERALSALSICADKIGRRRAVQVRAVATQACRAAENGPVFIARARRETGLKLDVISPKEEAALSVAGCANLLDHQSAAAVVVDVGGGSTELSWLDLRAKGDEAGQGALHAWLSIPIGVVTLAERFPERRPTLPGWFDAMVEHIVEQLDAFRLADPLRPAFAAGEAHLVGTSGAITSLAGLHLNLQRYDRRRVDGLWLTREDCQAAADRLLALEPHERAAEPCIGPDRADLVLAGAAILEAVQRRWPCPRVRVADRGLREGLLLSMIAEHGRGRPNIRRNAAYVRAAADIVR